MIIPVTCYALAISTVSIHFMPIKHFEFEFEDGAGVRMRARQRKATEKYRRRN